jgi:hypothetical protein
MIRRRRRERDIPFSFDSFLDIVANVVGVIIRLILVAWVGARSYHTLLALQDPAGTEPPASAELRAEEHPPSPELARQRAELARLQERLLEQLRQLQGARAEQGQEEGALASAVSSREELERQRGAMGTSPVLSPPALPLEELVRRRQQLAEEVRALEQLPSPSKALLYRTPVSQPVHSEELMFECRAGRVTFIDIGALLDEARGGLEEKGKQLRQQFQVDDVAGPVGAFRLRYTVERERSLFDSVVPGQGPVGDSFRYGLSEWHLEPLSPTRGETAEAALAKGSQFRQVIDWIDPKQTVVTLWVYPDSFSLFRRLRDYLYDRDVIVAGRPLPEGVPIGASRRGTVSRGQ